MGKWQQNKLICNYNNNNPGEEWMVLPHLYKTLLLN